MTTRWGRPGPTRPLLAALCRLLDQLPTPTRLTTRRYRPSTDPRRTR